MEFAAERLSAGGKRVMGSWYEAKLFIERATSVSNDALHVILGMLVLIVAALFLRRSVSSAAPWLVVLVFSLWNEAVDLWKERWPEPMMQYGEAAKDIVLTLLLPTLLLAAARYRPDLFRGSPRRGS